MYEKVLLPLGGSNLAECVLPYVRGLAAGGLTADTLIAELESHRGAKKV